DSRAVSKHPTDTCLKSRSIYQTPRSRKFSCLVVAEALRWPWVITTKPIQTNLSFFSHSTPTADRRQALLCYKGPLRISNKRSLVPNDSAQNRFPSPNPSFTEKSALIPTSD